MSTKKILVVRFSSIGDIVLTTPVVRCLKNQVLAEVHYITKEVFAPVLKGNPYIDKLHTFKTDITEILPRLKKEKFDLIIDLHNNLRSLRLKKALRVPSSSFNKINFRKFAAVNFKMIDALPKVHIVQRYLEAVAGLGIKDDGEGLDFFLGVEDEVELPGEKYVALVAGGSYYTKKIPVRKMQEICKAVKLKVVLLGGKEDASEAERVCEAVPTSVNFCGKYSIRQTAYILKHAEFVVSSDTGLMHIAAAFKKKVFSLWGNTIPEFGMGPYLPHPESRILEVKGLKCRPCSKLGFDRCPKGHFKCMMEIEVEKIG